MELFLSMFIAVFVILIIKKPMPSKVGTALPKSYVLFGRCTFPYSLHQMHGTSLQHNEDYIVESLANWPANIVRVQQ